MSPWRFEITDVAQRDIERLDTPVARRVKERLAWFVEHFDEVTPFPLGGEYKGFFKLRAGDWRIVYEVKEVEQHIIVHIVDHRSRVYGCMLR